jgi:hypothetical protein
MWAEIKCEMANKTFIMEEAEIMVKMIRLAGSYNISEPPPACRKSTKRFYSKTLNGTKYQNQ